MVKNDILMEECVMKCGLNRTPIKLFNNVPFLSASYWTFRTV